MLAQEREEPRLVLAGPRLEVEEQAVEWSLDEDWEGGSEVRVEVVVRRREAEV